MKLLTKQQNGEFINHMFEFFDSMKDLFAGDAKLNDVAYINGLFAESLRVQLDELESFRTMAAKPINADEKTVKIMFNVPYSFINININEVEDSSCKSEQGYYCEDIYFNESSVDVDNVAFEIDGWDPEGMVNFAKSKLEKS